MGGMPKHERRRPRPEQGASLVEFALILPVFAMLLFGMISAGLALNEKQQITHATRESARYAATVSANQTFTNGDTWANNVRDLLIERSAGTLTASDQICVSLVQGASATMVTPANTYSTSGAPCISGQPYPTTANDTGRRVQVTVTKPAKIELIIYGNYKVDIKANATAKSESNT